MLEIGVMLAVSVGTLTLLLAVFSSWNPNRGKVRKRLLAEFVGVGAWENPLYKDRDSLHSELADDDVPAPAKSWLKARLFDWHGLVADLLDKSGIALSPRQFLIAAVAAGVGLGGVVWAYVGPVGGAIGAIAGVVVPFALAVFRRGKRREKMQRQLVAAFDVMSRAMRSGHSVLEGFRAAAESADQPLSGELLRCQHQIEHGLRPEAAYRELSERTGVMEMRIFVVAMNVQRQTGGNLAEVLDRLAGVVRSRVRLKQKMRALTAEGRLQSAILTVLPVATFGVMYVLNRGYAEQLLVRWQLLAGTGVLMAGGLLWIRRIMNFEG